MAEAICKSTHQQAGCIYKWVTPVSKLVKASQLTPQLIASSTCHLANGADGCVGLSILIMTLLAKNTCGRSPGPILLVVSSHRYFRHSVVAGPALVMIVGCTSAASIAAFGKTRFITSPWIHGNLRATQRGHR